MNFFLDLIFFGGFFTFIKLIACVICFIFFCRLVNAIIKYFDRKNF